MPSTSIATTLGLLAAARERLTFCFRSRTSALPSTPSFASTPAKSFVRWLPSSSVSRRITWLPRAFSERTQRRAALAVDRRASSALARAAGVLLLERLLAAAGDFRADLRLVRAAVLARADLLHDLPH